MSATAAHLPQMPGQAPRAPPDAELDLGVALADLLDADMAWGEAPDVDVDLAATFVTGDLDAVLSDAELDDLGLADLVTCPDWGALEASHGNAEGVAPSGLEAPTLHTTLASSNTPHRCEVKPVGAHGCVGIKHERRHRVRARPAACDTGAQPCPARATKRRRGTDSTATGAQLGDHGGRQCTGHASTWDECRVVAGTAAEPAWPGTGMACNFPGCCCTDARYRIPVELLSAGTVDQFTTCRKHWTFLRRCVCLDESQPHKTCKKLGVPSARCRAWLTAWQQALAPHGVHFAERVWHHDCS